MTDKIPCPICDEGYLESVRDETMVEYRGVKSLRPMVYSVCTGDKGCGSEKQLQLNKCELINKILYYLEDKLTNNSIRHKNVF